MQLNKSGSIPPVSPSGCGCCWFFLCLVLSLSVSCPHVQCQDTHLLAVHWNMVFSILCHAMRPCSAPAVHTWLNLWGLAVLTLKLMPGVRSFRGWLVCVCVCRTDGVVLTC
jgi:hypothetical protein